jgi:hypothetical protein
MVNNHLLHDYLLLVLVGQESVDHIRGGLDILYTASRMTANEQKIEFCLESLDNSSE